MIDIEIQISISERSSGPDDLVGRLCSRVDNKRKWFCLVTPIVALQTCVQASLCPIMMVTWNGNTHNFLGQSFLIIWRTIISAKLKQNLIKYLNDNYHLPVLFEVYLTVSFHFPVKERRRSSDTIKQRKGSRRFFLSSLRGAWFYQIGWFFGKVPN